MFAISNASPIGILTYRSLISNVTILWFSFIFILISSLAKIWNFLLCNGEIRIVHKSHPVDNYFGTIKMMHGAMNVKVVIMFELWKHFYCTG